MNKKSIARFIHDFVESKYRDLISYSVIENSITEYPDGRFGFNCHSMLEKYGIGIDQFKKDFTDLLTIFSRVDKE
jgi:dsRNA-specific ribonuclease